eukprot:GHVP01068572.1.p1 GENE.GHVP01068572.1~~GHVP01068572.1.p1  ORF type:complete len:112 (-),score=17.78 GHVP01068572.1:53-388(-)
MGNQQSFTEEYREFPACIKIPQSQWQDFIKEASRGEKSLTVHTVLLPVGMDPRDPRLENAEIVEEHKYMLSPGCLPDATLKPATRFGVHVDLDAISESHATIPQDFIVIQD